jgi:hypothetical protein
MLEQEPPYIYIMRPQGDIIVFFTSPALRGRSPSPSLSSLTSSVVDVLFLAASLVAVHPLIDQGCIICPAIR